MDAVLQYLSQWWPLFLSNPPPFLFVAAVSASAAWWIKTQLSESQILALKEGTATKEGHLKFLEVKIADLREKLSALEIQIPRLTGELDEARELNDHADLGFALDKAIATAGLVKELASKANDANKALSDAVAELQDPVFEKILEAAEKDTLLGFVAYGLYRQSYRQWLSKVVEEGGSPPNKAWVANVSERLTHPPEIQKWLDDAREILHEYLSNAVEDHLRDFLFAHDLPNAQKPAWQRFYSRVLPVIVGNFLVILVVLIFLVATRHLIVLH